MQKTHASEWAVRGCFELKRKVGVRLDQTDTGATARHATTHATEGGGVEVLVHHCYEAKGVG